MYLSENLNISEDYLNKLQESSLSWDSAEKWIFAPVSMNGYTYPHIFLVKYEEISGA